MNILGNDASPQHRSIYDDDSPPIVLQELFLYLMDTLSRKERALECAII